MSRDGLFAASLARIHPVRRTPHVSLIVQGFWASALVFSGTFDQITDMLIFVSWAFYGLLALAVIVARVRFPDRPRPYRVPGYPWVPGVFVAFSAAYVLQSIVVNTRNAAFGSLLVAIGVPLYFALRRRRPAAPAAG
jgi:APA family basic amino acid/polyamine antiporter